LLVRVKTVRVFTEKNEGKNATVDKNEPNMAPKKEREKKAGGAFGETQQGQEKKK